MATTSFEDSTSTTLEDTLHDPTSRTLAQHPPTSLISILAIALAVSVPVGISIVVFGGMLKHYLRKTMASTITQIESAAESDSFLDSPPTSPMTEEFSSTETTATPGPGKISRHDSHHNLNDHVPAASLSTPHDNPINAELQAQLQDLQDTLHDLDHTLIHKQAEHDLEIASLARQLQATQAECAKHERTIRGLNSTIEAQAARHESELHDATGTTIEVREELVLVNKELDVTRLKLEHQADEIDNARLSSQLKDSKLEAAQATIEHLQQELLIRQDEHQQARSELEITAAGETDSALQQQYAQISAELAIIKSQLSDTEYDLDEVRKQKEKLEIRFDHLNDALTKAFTEIKSRNGDRAKIKELQRQIEEQDDKIDRLTEQKNLLDDQLRKTVIVSLEVSQAQRNTMKLEQEIETVKSEQAEQETKLVKHEAYRKILEKEITDLKKTNKELSKTDKSRQSQFQALESQRRTLQKDFEEKLLAATATSRINEEQLAADLQSKQQELDAAHASLQEIQTELSAVEARSQEARDEIHAASEQVNEAEVAVQTMEAKLAQAYKACIEREAQVQEDHRLQTDDIAASRQQLEAKLADIKKELGTLRTDLKTATTERAELLSRLSEVQEDLDNARSAREDILRQKILMQDDLSQQLAVRQSDIDLLKQSIDQLQVSHDQPLRRYLPNVPQY